MGTPEPVIVDGRPFEAGVMLVDKPAGLSSFGIIRKVRRLLGIKKVGHAGTLDPFATGLLIVCAGRKATRNIEQFMGGRKRYLATLQLGIATETQDPEGAVCNELPVPPLSDEDIAACLEEFVGPAMQAPPPWSAAKHKGKPLYHYARKGITIRKKPRPIEIYTMTGLGYDASTHRLSCEVTCSPGTYIRVLAADIGTRLGTCAHLIALRRTGSGGFHVDEAVAGAALDGPDGLEMLLAGMMDVDTALARKN